MLKTLRSRLWIGYSLLIIFVLGAFCIGLFLLLNRSSTLYRQQELLMRLEEQALLGAIESHSSDPKLAITDFLVERPKTDTLRILLIDNQGNIEFDSGTESDASIVWKNLAGFRRSENLNSPLMVRDTDKKIWLYIGKKLPGEKVYLVIAVPRGNLTFKFMLSDPMILMIFRVLIISIIVSVLLTMVMDRWLARPIRKMSKAARSMVLAEHKDLPVEGPKEVQDLADSLNQMSRQVRESQQSQRDFISDVSHELKTPLTSIQGFANAVLDGTANDEKSIKHSVQVISAESERMLRLVLDLLTLTRLEGGVENLRKTQLNISDLITGVVEKMALTANQAGVLIVNEIRELPMVTADTDRIIQVFTNLVDNAIKYSHPDGLVTLSSNFDEKWIRVHVADQGIGISSENQTKIFNRFYQVEKSRSAGNRKSAGLGLPIARQIARAHGGDIQVASTSGLGTTFTVVLPITNIK